MRSLFRTISGVLVGILFAMGVGQKESRFSQTFLPVYIGYIFSDLFFNRDVIPKYSFVILNRLNMDNYIEEFTDVKNFDS